MRKLSIQTIISHIETIAVVIAGLSAIGVGYTSYAAGLWDGDSLEKYSKATAALNDANTTFLSSSIQDQNLTDAEYDELQKQYSDEHDESIALTEEADTANKQGDRFQLISVYFSVVLFLSSLMAVLRKRKPQLAIVAISITLFVISTVLALTTKLPS